MQRLLITGANRGIGLELALQALERGDRVFAGCRDPQGATDLQSLKTTYPDDFEYEVFDRYINALNASSAILENNGFGADLGRQALIQMSMELQGKIRHTDYPRPPAQ